MISSILNKNKIISNDSYVRPNNILLIGSNNLKQNFIIKSILYSQPQQTREFIIDNIKMLHQQRYFWINLGVNNIMLQILPEFNFSQPAVELFIKKILDGININQSVPIQNKNFVLNQFNTFLNCNINSNMQVKQVVLFLDQNNINIDINIFINYLDIIKSKTGSYPVIFYDKNITDIILNILNNINTYIIFIPV